MEIYKNTHLIKLRAFLKPDFERLISWIDNEEAMVQFAGTYFSFPITKTQLQQYLDDKSRFVYKVVYTPTNTVIGHAEIFLNYPTAVFCRIIIGEEKYRGKGLGQQIIKSLLEISFTQLGAAVAMLNVFDWNIAAIKCYEKVGFTINPGMSRMRQVNGKTWRALNMSIDKTTWNTVKLIQNNFGEGQTNKE
jgi:RimJ/RimL family protein N-acetyltransferase